MSTLTSCYERIRNISHFRFLFVNRLTHYFVLLVLAVGSTATGASPKVSEQAPAALKTFLEHEGFGGAPLQRRFGNHLYAKALINGHRAALAIDTGCPFTLLDRASAREMGFGIKETKSHIFNVYGVAEQFAVGKLATL